MQIGSFTSKYNQQQKEFLLLQAAVQLGAAPSSHLQWFYGFRHTREFCCLRM
jgi:hypothetical protein